MILTAEVIAELERCIAALKEYQASDHDSPNVAHSAARRATLDATRKLASWRQVRIPYKGEK